MSNNTLVNQWQQVLSEVQLQMTKATFDTWVAPTFPLSLDDDTLTIGVRNAYAQQWLENRLRGILERVVNRVFAKPLDLKFILDTRPAETELRNAEKPDEPAPGDLYVEFIESPLTPYIFLQKYAIWFWQPLLGSLAFSAWVMLRTLDKLNEGRGRKHRISVDLTAQTLGCHRHSLTGRNPAQKLEGAFGVLNAEKLTYIDVIGKGHDAIYWARVLNAVPLLTPHQIEKLSPLLRERHAQFLSDFAIDADKWQQLELATLIQK